MVIDRILGNLDDGVTRSNIERISITSDDLAKRILRFETSVGDLGVRLPEGVYLHDGDVVYETPAISIAIAVEAEFVLIIRPNTIAQALEIAHSLGNRHLPVQSEDDTLIVRDDRLVETLVRERGVPYTRESRSLQNAFRHAHAPHGDHDRGSVRRTTIGAAHVQNANLHIESDRSQNSKLRKRDAAPISIEPDLEHHGKSNLAYVLLICDSAFPSGAFSHSFGLETAIAEGRVTDEGSLQAWLVGYLLTSFATFDGAAFAIAVRTASANDRAFASVLELDDALFAATTASEIRTANARIARSILDSLGATEIRSDLIARYREALASGEAAGSPSLVYALAYAALDIDATTAFHAFASTTLAALAGTATRAIPLGQRATTRVLWNLRPAIGRAAGIAFEAHSVSDLRASAFDQEIDAMRHRSLDGRLFAS